MTPEEAAAYKAMYEALTSIHEVDDNGWGDGTATVNIDYVKVQEALDLVDKARR